MSEPGALTCAKHPKETTYLRCNACNIPICPRCAVQTPVGYKCRDCGTFKHAAFAHPSLLQALAAFGVGVGSGVLAGLLLGFIGFWGIWLALPYGRFTGTLMLRASGSKMGLLMDTIAAVSIILGGLGGRVLAVFGPLLLRPDGRTLAHGITLQQLLTAVAYHPVALIAVIVVAAVTVSRLRWSWGWGI